MAVAKAAGLGLSTAKSAISSVASGIKAGAASHAGSGIISRAVGTAAIGGGIGAGVNAVRGDDVWEGAKRGAVMGGMASLGKSAYKGDLGRAWRHGTGQSNSDLRSMLTRGPSADAPFLSNSLGTAAGAKASVAASAGGSGASLPSAPASFNSKLVRSVNKTDISDFGQSTSFLDGIAGGSVKFGRNVGVQPPRSAPSAGPKSCTDKMEPSGQKTRPRDG